MSGSYTQTPNLGLFKPTPNSDTGTWGIHLNSNADTLDALLGTGGTLLTTGGTMTGPLVWTSTGTTTARAAQDRTADVANVLDFGAVGDGVTDNLAAFNAADASGKTLYVPPGTYIMSQVFWLHQGMFGDGMGRSIIKMSPSATGGVGYFHLVMWFAPGPSTVRDITLDGNNWAQSGIITATSLPQAGLRFERIEAKNFGWSTSTGVQNGIVINWDGTTPNQKNGCVITDCYVHDCPSAMGIGAGGQGHVISNNTVINCGHSGIGCYNNPLIDGVIIGNTVNTTGTNLNASSDGITGYDYANNRVLIVGNTVENSINHGIHIGGNNIQINNNKIHGVINGSGIMLQSSPNTAPTPGVNGLISGNEIDTVQVGAGIYIGYHSRIVVTSNTVLNIGQTTSQSGIQFIISSDCVCSNNIVYNVLNDAIYGNTALNLIVCGNRIDTITGGAGIHDSGGTSTGMTVFGNTITNASIATAAAFSGTFNVRSGIAVGGGAGFNGQAPIAKPTVTGAKGGNAALGSLLTALANYGLVTDSTTA